jgi:hypothetical protein
MSDDDSMDVCDSLDMIDQLYGGGASSPVGDASCSMMATVHFQSSVEVEVQHQTSASSLSLSQHHDSPDGYYVPLEKVGRNYRCLRRRGAAVHSQLLKNAFEASMNSYDSDGDGDDCSSSMYASNSTICSRDGVEDIQSPRKRIRHPVGVGEPEDESESLIQQASNLFEGLGLAMQHQSATLACSSSANSVSSEEDSDTIPEHSEHGGSRRRIQRTVSCALRREHYQG